MAAASARAGRGRRSGRSGIAADQAIASRPPRASVCRQRRFIVQSRHSPKLSCHALLLTRAMFSQPGRGSNSRRRAA
jgi:hypothetical protein